MTTFRKRLMTSSLIAALVVCLSAGAAVSGSYVGLTADDVKQVVNEHYPKVKRCYAKYAKRQKRANGKVLLHLQVSASGKVADVDVEAPSVRGKRFARCVTKVAKRWRFPKASGGTDVTYPFLFVHGHRHARRSHRRSRR